MNIGIMGDVLSHLRQLRTHDHWSREQLEAHQAQGLQLLRAEAYAHSPFYQRFHQGLFDVPLQELPVLTKAMLMEHFDEVVTDRRIHLEAVMTHVAQVKGDERFLDRYWANATSGSSGHPGVLLLNRAEWVTVLASFARAQEWAGIKLDLTHRVKMATVASTTPFHMSARVNATVGSWWRPTLYLAASDPPAQIVEQLNRWQPEILIGYASMMRLLADEQLAGRLQISPRAIFTSSEVLTEQTRRLVVQAWGERIYNQYAATELGSVAAECEQHQDMHLTEDLAIFEVVDRGNRPVPAGVFGDKLLITVLGSRTMPLIRYELNDSLRLSMEPCVSGRPFRLIEAVQGRVEDVLSFPGITGGRVRVQPLIFTRIMDTLPVSGWQVVQEAAGLRVLLSGVHGDVRDEWLTQALEQALLDQGALVSPIAMQHVDTIPKTAAGKAPLVKSDRSAEHWEREALLPETS